MKNRASREKNEVYFNFSEAQPVLSKSKTNLFDFALPLKTLKSLKPLKPLNFYRALKALKVLKAPKAPKFLLPHSAPLKTKQGRRSAFLLYPFNYYICNNN